MLNALRSLVGQVVDVQGRNVAARGVLEATPGDDPRFRLRVGDRMLDDGATIFFSLGDVEHVVPRHRARTNVIGLRL